MINPFNGRVCNYTFFGFRGSRETYHNSYKTLFPPKQAELDDNKNPIRILYATHRDINISLGNVLANDFPIKTVLFKIIRQSKHGGNKNKKKISLYSCFFFLCQ